MTGTNPRTGNGPQEASFLSRQLQAGLADFPQESLQDSRCGNPHKGQHTGGGNGF